MNNIFFGTAIVIMSIIGSWKLPIDKAYLHVKNNTNVKLEIRTKCNKPIMVLFDGKVDGNKDTFNMNLNSKLQKITIDGSCFVSHAIVAIGTNVGSDMQVIGSLITYKQCNGKHTEKFIDDIGGLWKKAFVVE